MKFRLENPQHQMTAIQSVVDIFRGMERNTYDNAHNEDIQMKVLFLKTKYLKRRLFLSTKMMLV